MKEPRKTEIKSIVANHVFEIIGMDIVTPLKISMRGNKHLIVVTDYYTRPMPYQTSKQRWWQEY